MNWPKLNPHPQQSSMYRSRSRFLGAACGRGSGKTEIARRALVRHLPIRKPWSDPLYFMAAPTYPQVKRQSWEKILDLIPRAWHASGSPNLTDLCITTVFGSRLFLVGMDKPERIEGNQWDFGVVDESCDVKPTAYRRTILPALTHKRGACWRIGVPKRTGVGAADYRRFCSDPNVEAYQWPSSTVLPQAELEHFRAHMDEATFREQFEASWENAGGLIFYAFDEDTNIVPNDYIPARPIYVGCDFNVNPMCWTLAHHVGNELHVFDELFIRNTNTKQTMQALHAKYPHHTSGWTFFGDASGQNRHTSSSMSDYLIIHNDTSLKNKRCVFPKANPAQRDRFAACNALMEHGRCKISPRCTHLIEDLQSHAFKEGTMIPDESDKDRGHMTDAFGYCVCLKFPLLATMPQHNGVYFQRGSHV